MYGIHTKFRQRDQNMCYVKCRGTYVDDDHSSNYHHPVVRLFSLGPQKDAQTVILRRCALPLQRYGYTCLQPNKSAPSCNSNSVC